MKRLILFVFIAFSTAFLVARANAGGDPAAGKKKATPCTACHGPTGVSMNPLWPNIAGQKVQYLVKQLKAFKEGTRQDPLMSPQASTLTTTDMSDLAAYFTGLPCSPQAE